MKILETIILFISITLTIAVIMLLTYSAGRVFVSGMFHQIADIVKKMEQQTKHNKVITRTKEEKNEKK